MIKRIIIRNGKKYIVNVPNWDDEISWGDQVGTGSYFPILPFVITNPISQTVSASASSSVSFVVVAAPAGPFDNMTYQWQRNNVNVVDNSLTTGSNSFTLILNQITSSAVAGTYKALIVTSNGNTSSLGAVLTVA